MHGHDNGHVRSEKEAMCGRSQVHPTSCRLRATEATLTEELEGEYYPPHTSRTSTQKQHCCNTTWDLKYGNFLEQNLFDGGNSSAHDDHAY